MFNLKCLLGKHKPLLLNTLNKGPVIKIHETGEYMGTIVSNPLINIQMCENCKLLYWENV